MVSLVRKLQHNLLQCTLSLGGLALDMSRGGMKGFLFFLGRRMTLSHLVSGSPMMWFIGVWQVLHQHNELRDGELGLSTMEMSYWHPPSSLTMCWQWRALDLSWRFHCSHNSLMAPSAGSHPSRFLQTFVIEITLLICFPYSCIFGKYWTRKPVPDFALVHLCMSLAACCPAVDAYLFICGDRDAPGWNETFPWQFRWLHTPALWLWWRWQSCRSA